MTKNRRHKINSNMTLSKWIFFAATCGVVFALYFMFCVVPILQSVKMSFYKWGGYKTKTYIQWKNYADVLKDRVFWKALKNDLIITLIKEILICSLTVLFAVTLTRFRMKTPEVVLYKFVFYIPNVISTIIIGSLWGFVFMPSGMGLMNSICSIFKSGVDVAWVTKYPLGVIGFVASWCGVGLFMLTMIASIHQIPGELYEAAKIDGASETRICFQIVLPLCVPVLATLAFNFFVNQWNSWTTTMIYITSPRLYSLQYLLQKILAEAEFLKQMADMGTISENTELMPTDSLTYAMAMVAAGPVLVVFPLFQKYFVKGMTIGSVKG